MFGCIQAPVTDLLGMGGLTQYPVKFNYQFWRKQEAREPVSFKFNLLDVGPDGQQKWTAQARHEAHARSAEAAALPPRRPSA